jgi:superfamily II DNA helicase RecQ
MAEFLGIPAANIIVHYAESSTRNPRASHTTTPVTPPPRSSSKSKRPFDSFEPQASTSQATCRAWCKKPILKNTERIGIQRQFLQCTGWKPHYYHHRKCVSDETTLALQLPEDSNKQTKRNEDSTVAPETKLGYEREHQTEIEASKRSLVYSRRKDLRTALYSLRMELAREQHKQPPCVVFDNAAIDDIVIKLQTNESELIKCRGIGNTRC